MQGDHFPDHIKFPDLSSTGKQRLPSIECLPIWSTLDSHCFTVWGSVVSSPSGVRGGAPAEKRLLEYLELEKTHVISLPLGPDFSIFSDFSLTTLEFPDFSRWVVTLYMTSIPQYAHHDLIHCKQDIDQICHIYFQSTENFMAPSLKANEGMQQQQQYGKLQRHRPVTTKECYWTSKWLIIKTRDSRKSRQKNSKITAHFCENRKNHGSLYGC